MSGFINDIFKLMSGTLLAQLINVIISPIITRLYGPEAFGLASLFITIAGILGSIACLRYESAIVLAEHNEESANILVLCFFISILTSFISLIFFHLFGVPFCSLLNASELIKYLWLLPIFIFLTGVSVAMSYWINRQKDYGVLSLSKFGNSVLTGFTRLGLGWTGFTSELSLIYSAILGTILSASIMCIHIWYSKKFYCNYTIHFNIMKSSLNRYKKFPIYDTWASLITSLQWQLPIFILSFFFSPVIVGYYSLSMMVLQLPVSLLGTAVSQVFFQRVAEAKNFGKIDKLVEGFFINLFAIGVCPFLLISAIGSDFFRLAFGPNWIEAGVYSQILAFWMLFLFITSPISTLFSILEMQRAALVINIITLPLRSLALVVGGMLGNALLAIILFALSGVLIYGLVNIWLLRKSEVIIAPLPKKIFKYFLLSSLIFSLIFILKYIFLIHGAILICLSIIMLLGYYYICFNKYIFKSLEAIYMYLNACTKEY